LDAPRRLLPWSSATRPTSAELEPRKGQSARPTWDGTKTRAALREALEAWSFRGKDDQIRMDVLAQLLEAAVVAGDREQAPVL